MTTYQDVVRANSPLAGWALSEASGTDFVPWIGSLHATASGVLDYQQPGPFASALAVQLHVGATWRAVWPFQPTPIVWHECWFKFPNPPSAQSALIETGNNSNTGFSVYVTTTSHIRYVELGKTDYDTGILWPDSNWHLLQVGNLDSSQAYVGVMLDGQLVWQQKTAGANSISPATVGFLTPGSGAAASIQGLIAYPALYATPISWLNLQATFTAATDPATALDFTLSGNLGGGSTTLSLLNQILSSVRKTYTAP